MRFRNNSFFFLSSLIFYSNSSATWWPHFENHYPGKSGCVLFCSSVLCFPTGVKQKYEEVVSFYLLIRPGFTLKLYFILFWVTLFIAYLKKY